MLNFLMLLLFIGSLNVWGQGQVYVITNKQFVEESTSGDQPVNETAKKVSPKLVTKKRPSKPELSTKKHDQAYKIVEEFAGEDDIAKSEEIYEDDEELSMGEDVIGYETTYSEDHLREVMKKRQYRPKDLPHLFELDSPDLDEDGIPIGAESFGLGVDPIARTDIRELEAIPSGVSANETVSIIDRKPEERRPPRGEHEMGIEVGYLATEIESVDTATQGLGNLQTKAGVSFDLYMRDYYRAWWNFYIHLGLTKLNFSDSSGRFKSSNVGRGTYHAGMGFNSLNGWGLEIEGGIKESVYIKGIVGRILKLQKVPVGSALIAAQAPLYRNNRTGFYARLSGGYIFPAEKNNLKTTGGTSYEAKIFYESWYDNGAWLELGPFWRRLYQNSVIADQTHTEFGLTARLSFDL